MTTNQFKTLLKKMGACKNGRDWVQRQIKKGKSPKGIWESCNNGNYLFWLYSRLNIIDWDKYHDFKCEHDIYAMLIRSREYDMLKLRFVRETIKYKDFHTAAIKFLKRNKAGEFHV
jgi:hypothetical protein